MRTRDEVTKAFTPVENKFLTETQKILIQKFGVEFCDLAEKIAIDIPETADRTACLRTLLEAKFMCSQAITHSGTNTKVNAPVTKPTEKTTNGKNQTTVHAS